MNNVVPDRFKLPNPEFEAEIYYLTEQEGGRYAPFISGYRGQFHYNGSDWDAPQEFVNKEICNSGEAVKVKIQTASPLYHIGQLYAGQEFETREGTRTVGHGKITRILRQDFNYWDYAGFFGVLPASSKPFEFQKIAEFARNLKSGLENVWEIAGVKLTKALSDKNQMVIVECKTKDKMVHGRPLADEICKYWKSDIRAEKLLYKTSLKHLDGGFKFELLFAISDGMYLTGKITVETN